MEIVQLLNFEAIGRALQWMVSWGHFVMNPWLCLSMLEHNLSVVNSFSESIELNETIEL